MSAEGSTVSVVPTVRWPDAVTLSTPQPTREDLQRHIAPVWILGKRYAWNFERGRLVWPLQLCRDA